MKIYKNIEIYVEKIYKEYIKRESIKICTMCKECIYKLCWNFDVLICI